MKKTKKKTQDAPVQSSFSEDFDALLNKHGCGWAIVIHEVAENDPNGNARWLVTHRGNPARLEMMCAHGLAIMSARRERQLAEIARDGMVR